MRPGSLVGIVITSLSSTTSTFEPGAYRTGWPFTTPTERPAASTAAPFAVGFRVLYAKSGDLQIAYSVLGNGPVDFVWTAVRSRPAPLDRMRPSGRSYLYFEVFTASGCSAVW